MIIDKLGHFAAEMMYDQLPRDIAEAIKIRILDLLSAHVSGYRIETYPPLLPLLADGGPASIWILGRRSSPRDAAMMNSFLAHASYMDDGSRFTGGHPSSVVIPAAVALAEARQASGKDLIAAVAAGYEVFLRLGRALYPSIVNRGFQSTAVLGAVSAAAACSRIIGLNAQQTKNAMALACSLGVGLKEALKSSESQPVQVGRSTEAGLFCALFAEQGSAGADTIVEKGLFPAFGDSIDASPVTRGLGTQYSIHETYIKVHGGCRGNHAPIDAVLEVVKAYDLDVEQIEKIVIVVDTVTLAGEIHHPVNGAQAQFSIAFAVAVHLLRGDASAFRYTNENLADDRVQALMRRVEVCADPAFDADYPQKRAASAQVRTRDGRTLTAFLGNARGEPEYPLTRDEVEGKFLSLAAPVFGHRSQDICTTIKHLETLADLGPLLMLLNAEPPSDRTAASALETC